MALEISYLPVWYRYLQQLRDAGITNEDAGELFFAMMEYHFEDKPQNLTGAGRYIWPFIVPDIDQAKAKYAASVANGAKGGKKKPSPNPEEPGGNPGATQGEPSPNPAEPMSKTKTMSKTSLSSGEDKESTPAPAKQAKKAFGEFGWVKLTDDEYNRLLNDLGEAEVKRCIAYVDESAQTTGNKNKWRDWNLVVRKCHKQGWGISTQTHYGRRKDVPMGASGQLGAAELENIQRLLAEDNNGDQ